MKNKNKLNAEKFPLLHKHLNIKQKTYAYVKRISTIKENFDYYKKNYKMNGKVHKLIKKISVFFEH